MHLYNPAAIFESEKEEEFNLVNSYLKLAELSSNLEIIIEIVEKIEGLKKEIELLNLILEKSLILIPEAAYGRIFLNNGDDNGYFLEKVYKKDYISVADFNFFKRNFSESEVIIFKKQKVLKKITLEFKNDRNIVGAIILFCDQKNIRGFSKEAQEIALILEKISSFYLKINSYQKRQQNFKKEIILTLTNLLEIHDLYTKGHNQSVADLSKELAQALNLKESEVKRAYWSGILHDIGKSLIPKNILNKKTKLTKEEFSIIKKHPYWGYKILKDSTQLKEIAEYVLYHHEKWDGSGYPEGLKGREIPLISQIVAIADSWDAMCSNRAYRKALSRKKAVVQIKINKGKQFSPQVAAVFLKNIV